MQHRQVEEGEAATGVVFDQMAHQRLADAGSAAVRGDRQAPERRAAIRVLEGLDVIEPHHRADDGAAVVVLCQPVHRATLVPRGQSLGVDGQHVTLLVEAVYLAPVLGGAGPADAKATIDPSGRTIVAEPDPQGVAGVEKQLLRCLGQHLVGRGHIEGDVALARRFGEQFLGQAGGVGIGMADEQPAPAAMQGERLAGRLVAFRQARLQPFVGGRLGALEALVVAGRFHGCSALTVRARSARG